MKSTTAYKERQSKEKSGHSSIYHFGCIPEIMRERYYYSMLSVFTGYPRAILDGTYVTAMRTAAASGVAVKHLARQDAQELAIVGAGVQGQYHTLCMLHLLKNLKRIKVYDIYQPSIQRYQDAMRPYTEGKVDIQTVSSFEEAITGSDVIVCATGTLRETVMFDKWMKKGALLLPVHRRGWNKDLLSKMDKVVVDDFDQFVYHEKQTFDPLPDAPSAFLGDIVVGKKPGRENEEERIVCYNVGLGMYDVVIGAKIVEKAKAKGLGQELTLMDLSKKPPLPPIN